MNKCEMIEDKEQIARIIAFELCPYKYHKERWGENAKCYSDNNYADCAKIKEVVDKLYNANYRKVGDDEIVIKTDIECVDNTTPANVIEFFVKHNAEVRQETAREILLQIKHDFVEHPALTIFEIIDRIADKYDVNLEECHE